MALTDKGEIWIIEIKSGLADFQSDTKWPDYLPYCDRFYFAVAADFPTDILPQETGLIFADQYGAEIISDNKQEKLAAARRNLLLRRMARIGVSLGAINGKKREKLTRCALGQYALQSASVHIQPPRRLRYIAVA